MSYKKQYDIIYIIFANVDVNIKSIYNKLDYENEVKGMGLLYTIGHSQHEFEYFSMLLKTHNVNYLLDVRSVPYSKHAETYNKEYLSKLLEKKNISYSYMGKYFGARQKNTNLYNKEGYLDFEQVVQSDFFIKGMKNVILGLDKGNNIVLMCTEKDPIDCHRAIMIARAFSLNGIEVTHIMPDGGLQTQKELDERLLDMYFPDRAQLSIFDFDNEMSDEERLKLAYQKRNKEIGYHLQNIVV